MSPAAGQGVLTSSQSGKVSKHFGHFSAREKEDVVEGQLVQ
uniref:Uncharacterized protein n=1 Tax=Physcomitrium patens TaxID=3218 RepID=A0A2K1JIN4_PHYPA|nr:hypothetical protein PHYPA_018782 [Physcomitrium patens]